MGHLVNSTQAAEHVLLIIGNGEFIHVDLIYNVGNVIAFASTLAVVVVVFKNFIYELIFVCCFNFFVDWNFYEETPVEFY